MTTRLARWASLTLGALAASFVISPSQAQPTRIADLGISASVSPVGPLLPGSTARLTLTIRNDGPDEAPAVGAVSSAYPTLDFALFELAPALPNPCFMDFDDFIAPPGQPSMVVAIVNAGSLAAGASRQCTLDLRVLPPAAGSMDLSFFVNDGQVFIVDSNASNDNVTIPLQFGSPAVTRPRMVPSTDAFALLVLVSLMVVVSSVRLGRG